MWLLLLLTLAALRRPSLLKSFPVRRSKAAPGRKSKRRARTTFWFGPEQSTCQVPPPAFQATPRCPCQPPCPVDSGNLDRHHQWHRFGSCHSVSTRSRSAAFDATTHAESFSFRILWFSFLVSLLLSLIQPSTAHLIPGHCLPNTGATCGRVRLWQQHSHRSQGIH